MDRLIVLFGDEELRRWIGDGLRAAMAMDRSGAGGSNTVPG
jgi:hypothetical protein